MSRYFFHIRDRDALVVDEEGIELASLEMAREEAAKSVRDLRSEADFAGENIDHQIIEVADGKGVVCHTTRLDGVS
jgi:hypothetical protein